MPKSSFYSSTGVTPTEADAVEGAKNAAATSATNAATSETNAALSATSAASSASTAATKASEALTSATNAANSATGVTTAETNAAASATSAASSASTATTKASEAATSATNAATSASTATTKATEAATSAASALTAKTNAEAAETNAETAETNAAASATSAASSASTATTKASEAATSATNAANSATNVATYASQASTSATNAANSASTASTKASEAATSATNAASSASSASSAQTAAEAARDSAEAVYDSFDDRYLGAKSSDPTADNDGNALLTGALYFNTTSAVMKVYDSSQWKVAYVSSSGGLLAANDLSDLSSASAARTNLGLGTAATTASTDYATAAQGTTADNALPKSGGAMTGAITTNSTFDGRDVSADGTKLDGIEAGATADQTAAEIKTAYESNSDTNAFTDADHSKLDNIEANADVTDTANVTAAGALMDSEVTNLAQVKAFDSADYATAAQGTTADSALQNVVEDTTPQLGGDLGTNGNDILFADNDKAIFGAGNDLQIYHDGNHSWIKDAGSGNIYISSDGYAVNFVKGDNAATVAQFIPDGPVNLYNAGSKKLATTSTGIDVTGTVSADGLTVDSSLATINSSGPNVDLVLTESNTNTDARIRNSNGILEIDADLNNEFGSSSIMFAVDGTDKLKIDNNGDISFYEDTGTTPKFFWDASAESLGIGTSSPSDLLNISGSSNQIGLDTGDQATYGTLDIGHFINGAFIGTQAGSNAASNILRLGTSGIERMRIDSSGNVGIGTNLIDYQVSNRTVVHIEGSAGALLALEDTGAKGYLFQSGNDLLIENDTASGNMIFGTNSSTERMRIDSNGDVAIGRASVSSIGGSITNLHIGGKIASRGGGLRLSSSDDSLDMGIYPADGVCNVSAFTSTPLVFKTNNTERMRIDSSGNVLVGTASSSIHNTTTTGFNYLSDAWLSVNSTNESLLLTQQNQTAWIRFYYQNGGEKGSISYNGTGTSYNTSSDQRLKENIQDANDAGSKIDAIQVRQFDWKADGSHQDYGVIAQELIEVAPEAVSGDADSEEMMGVDYSKLVPMLIKEIQSLRNRVAQLENN